MGKSLGIHPYRGDLPAEQIVRGMELIDHNSREIIEDAKLLIESGRYARAVALSVIALEESAKKSVLLVLYAVQADDKLRKRVWQEYRSHTSKASFIVRRPAIRGAFEGQNIEEKAQRMGRLMDLYKQMGLYADSYETDEGVRFWSTPSETFPPDKAKSAVEMISKHLGGGATDETEEEKIREFRWRVILAIDEHPQDQALERVRAMGRATVATTKDHFEDDSEFLTNMEKNIRSLLGEDAIPAEDT